MLSQDPGVEAVMRSSVARMLDCLLNGVKDLAPILYHVLCIPIPLEIRTISIIGNKRGVGRHCIFPEIQLPLVIVCATLMGKQCAQFPNANLVKPTKKCFPNSLHVATSRFTCVEISFGAAYRPASAKDSIVKVQRNEVG